MPVAELLLRVGSAEMTDWFAIFEMERRELEKARGEQPLDVPPAMLGA